MFNEAINVDDKTSFYHHHHITHHYYPNRDREVTYLILGDDEYDTSNVKMLTSK